MHLCCSWFWSLCLLNRFDFLDGSLHDQASEFTNDAFQASLKLIGTGGRDLGGGKKIVPLR